MNDTPQTVASDPAAASVISPDALEILVCPLTRSRLTLDGQELVGQVGGLRYPIREGIPIMLITEATLPADVQSLDEFKAKYVKNAS